MESKLLPGLPPGGLGSFSGLRIQDSFSKIYLLLAVPQTYPWILTLWRFLAPSSPSGISLFPPAKPLKASALQGAASSSKELIPGGSAHFVPGVLLGHLPPPILSPCGFWSGLTSSIEPPLCWKEPCLAHFWIPSPSHGAEHIVRAYYFSNE